jgi:mannitol/fructose-specific phosphotransferase system IIA component (Ntr-type)
MSTLSESLLRKDVRLELKATDPHDSLEEILSPLRGDPRVRDWDRLRETLIANASNDIFREVPGAMFLHHGRTESVSELVLAIGRSSHGIVIPGLQERIHLIFIAAIPEALNNEYLRILGAISRVCHDPFSLRELLDTNDAAEFLALMEKGCRE